MDLGLSFPPTRTGQSQHEILALSKGLAKRCLTIRKHVLADRHWIAEVHESAQISRRAKAETTREDGDDRGRKAPWADESDAFDEAAAEAVRQEASEGSTRCLDAADNAAARRRCPEGAFAPQDSWLDDLEHRAGARSTQGFVPAALRESGPKLGRASSNAAPTGALSSRIRRSERVLVS